MKPLRKEDAEEIFNILVETCGANESLREKFVIDQTDQYQSEFRFSGHLGFGGKFKRQRESFFVDYYIEHKNDQRDLIVASANDQLNFVFNCISEDAL